MKRKYSTPGGKDCFHFLKSNFELRCDDVHIEGKPVAAMECCRRAANRDGGQSRQPRLQRTALRQHSLEIRSFHGQILTRQTMSRTKNN